MMKRKQKISFQRQICMVDWLASIILPKLNATWHDIFIWFQITHICEMENCRISIE